MPAKLNNQVSQMNQLNNSTGHQSTDQLDGLLANHKLHRETPFNSQANLLANHHFTADDSSTVFLKRINQAQDIKRMKHFSSLMSHQKHQLANMKKLAAYQKYRNQLRSNIQSNIRKYHNRKYVNYRRREDRPASAASEDDEPKEKYNQRYNEGDDPTGKKSDSDYDEQAGKPNGHKEVSAGDEEGRQVNEKTDYDPVEPEYKAAQRPNAKQQTSKDAGDANGGLPDYDTKGAAEDDENLAEDEATKEDSMDDDKIKDKMEDKFKEDDGFRDPEANADRENEDNSLNSLKHQNEVKSAIKEKKIAMRFSPLPPTYSRPFTPTEKLKYNSVDDDDTADTLKDAPPMDMNSFSEDEKRDDGFKENSKEVNYSLFDLNRINSPSDEKHSDMKKFEKHEELLIELLKRRFLANQKRMLELKKHEKRRQFLNEIVDDSFSLRKLNQEAVKYAMLEKKLNRLINLIQEQQKHRDLGRLTHHPMHQRDFLNSFNSFLSADQLGGGSDSGQAGLEARLKSMKKNRFKPLFGPNAHLYPINRFSFYRPPKANAHAGHPMHPANRLNEHRLAEQWSEYMSNYGDGYAGTPAIMPNFQPPLPPPAHQQPTAKHLTNYHQPNYHPSNYHQSNYPFPMYPPGFQGGYSVKRYPIYKRIKPNESSSHDHQPPPSSQFNDRHVPSTRFSLNNFSLNNLSLNSLFGTSKQPQSSGLFSAILQPTDSHGFRKLPKTPIKYQYHLLHNLAPSIPLRLFTNEKPASKIVSLPQLGGIMFKGSGYL